VGRVAVDDGSGSILTVALLGAVTALTVMLLPLYVGLATRQSVAGAADAAALAGADAAVGIVAGIPCETAGRVAAANGASIVSCDVDGLIVTVVAARMMLGVSVTAAATAGPGDSPVD
jgi:secretion/DNA translocation related TadE-like protein